MKSNSFFVICNFCLVITSYSIHYTKLYDEIGVTGSLLIGAQRPDSDIDLVFYRPEPFFKARDAIRRLLAAGTLEPLDEALWRDSYNFV